MNVVTLHDTERVHHSLFMHGAQANIWTCVYSVLACIIAPPPCLHTKRGTYQPSPSYCTYFSQAASQGSSTQQAVASAPVHARQKNMQVPVPHCAEQASLFAGVHHTLRVKRSTRQPSSRRLTCHHTPLPMSPTNSRSAQHSAVHDTVQCTIQCTICTLLHPIKRPGEQSASRLPSPSHVANIAVDLHAPSKHPWPLFQSTTASARPPPALMPLPHARIKRCATPAGAAAASPLLCHELISAQRHVLTMPSSSTPALENTGLVMPLFRAPNAQQLPPWYSNCNAPLHPAVWP